MANGALDCQTNPQRELPADNVSRRRFLGTSTAAAGAMIVPRHVLGGQGQQPPSETVAGALIGCGPRGLGAWRAMCLQEPRLLAVCDVDQRHIERRLKSEQADPRALTIVRELRDLADGSGRLMHGVRRRLKNGKKPKTRDQMFSATNLGPPRAAARPHAARVHVRSAATGEPHDSTSHPAPAELH